MSRMRIPAAPWRLAVFILFVTYAGLVWQSAPAQANTAVGHAIGSMVNSADSTIKQLEQEIADTLKGLDDPKLKDALKKAGSPADKLKAAVERYKEMSKLAKGIEDFLDEGHEDNPFFRPSDAVPWNDSQLGRLQKLVSLYGALTAWTQIRDAYANAYQAVMGKVYQVSQALPAVGPGCDEEEFAVNTVEVSTLFGKAVRPVERDFAANRPLRPQDTQVAVLTDLQQNPSGQAESGPGKTLKLAQSSGNGTHTAGGGGLDFKVGGRIQFRGEFRSDAQDDSSADEEVEFFGGSANWLRGEHQTNSQGLDKNEPLTDIDIHGAYIDCSKLSIFIPYGDMRYDTLTGGQILHVPTGLFIDAGRNGVTKAHTPCHQTRTSDFGDDDKPWVFLQTQISFGDRYRDGNAQVLIEATIVEMANDFKLDPSSIFVDFFQAATGEGGYATINIPGEGYRLNDGGCIADLEDFAIYNGEWVIQQPRYGQPATGAQLAAGGVQVAALPERLPEDRVQVAAAAAKALPNDFYFHSKGNIRKGVDDQWALKAIGFKPVGRNGKGSLWPKRATPVLVAVVDTGLDPTHPDIAGAIYANPKEKPGNGKDDDKNGYVDDVFGWNFVDNSNNTWDNNGHGTFIAGIIAARTDDKIGIAGVNPWARILPVKVTDFDNAGESVNLMEGIYYAAKMGARVINVSIGGKKLTKAEQFAIEYANDMGALVIVAAGNDGIDVSDYSPAGIPGAITVAATDRKNKRGKFSNFGAAVDIAAPGVEVMSLRARQTDLMLLADETYKPGTNIIGPGGLYYHLSGTSFSAPLVAGVASLLFSIDQDLTPDQVKRMILQSAKDIEEPGFDWLTGYGLLDAAAAIKADPAFFVDARLGDVGLVEQGGQNFLQPVGTASADKFKRAWIEVGQGKSPKKWVKASADMSKGVTEGALALVGVQHFTSGGDWTLKLVVEHKNGRKREARYTLALE